MSAENAKPSPANKYAIPEGTVLASAGIRLIAQIVDGLIALGLGFAAMFGVGAVAGDGPFAALAFLVFYLGYFLFSDGLKNGQSLGKRIFGIRVIDFKSQNPCSHWQSFCRNFAQVLGIVDWVFILFKDRRRAGDYFADTLVVAR